MVLLQPDAATIASVTKTSEQTYDYVKKEFLKKYKLHWLKPIGFNNSYALMMRKKQSEKLGVKSITGLKNYLDKH